MKSLTRHDLYLQVAELHARNLDQGFLSTLGTDFLALLYQAIDEADGSVLLVESHEGEVIGFVSGGIGMGTVYRRLLDQPVRLAKAVAPCILQPKRLLRVVEIVRYGGGGATPRGLPSAELFSIAVSPAWRGRGVAERLYMGLIAHFEQVGIAEFRITVGEGLATAHRFYRRMGALPAAKVQVHNGERSQVYLHRVGGLEAAASDGTGD